MPERKGASNQPNPAETGQKEPPVFDFRDPKITFEAGTRITGMQSWTDVHDVLNRLIGLVARTAEPDPNTHIHFKNGSSLETKVLHYQEKKGFYGTKSTDFEIEMLPTDLSFDQHKDRRKFKPELARTFKLLRRVYSSALPNEGRVISTDCTLILTDIGVGKYILARSYEESWVHSFSGSIILRNSGNEGFFKTINNSKINAAAPGGVAINPRIFRRSGASRPKT